MADVESLCYIGICVANFLALYNQNWISHSNPMWLNKRIKVHCCVSGLDQAVFYIKPIHGHYSLSKL